MALKITKAELEKLLREAKANEGKSRLPFVPPRRDFLTQELPEAAARWGFDIGQRSAKRR